MRTESALTDGKASAKKPAHRIRPTLCVSLSPELYQEIRARARQRSVRFGGEHGHVSHIVGKLLEWSVRNMKEW
jgi:hypothetical protein